MANLKRNEISLKVFFQYEKYKNGDQIFFCEDLVLFHDSSTCLVVSYYIFKH